MGHSELHGEVVHCPTLSSQDVKHTHTVYALLLTPVSHLVAVLVINLTGTVP